MSLRKWEFVISQALISIKMKYSASPSIGALRFLALPVAEKLLR